MNNTAIGIDIGGTSIKLGVVQNGTEIIARDQRPSPHQIEALADTVGAMASEVLQRFPDAPIGISTAGALTGDGLLTANQFGFVNAPLGPLIREKYQLDIPMENDGICALVGEHAYGALKGWESAVMLTLGTGIGGGVIVNGKPYRGMRGAHSELGHMITHADGLKCSCLQTGCFEMYASGSALTRMSGGMKPGDIIDAVRRGECLDIWNTFIYELKQGLIGIFSAFAPGICALGGGISHAGDILFTPLRALLQEDEGYRAYFSDIQVVPAAFLNDAGILGAAAMAQEKTLTR